MVQKSKYFFAILTVLIGCNVVAKVNAAGMTVAPTYVKFSIADSASVDSASVTIKNDSSQTAQYKAVITDVTSDTGVLSPLDTASTVTKDTFEVDIQDFTLQPSQSINIMIKVKNTKNLTAGGHYAALTIQQVFLVKGKQQPITQIVSVGIFLTKEDGAIRLIKLQAEPVKKLLFTTLKQENIKVVNSGNVELVPRAVINITKGTQVYQKALLNESSQTVFPLKSEVFLVKYTKLKNMPVGRYTKSIAYRYDGQKDQTILTESFWYVPISFAINCFVLVLLILMVIILKRRKRTKVTPQYIPKQYPAVRAINDKAPLTTIEDMTKNAIRISKPRSSRKKIQDVGAEIKNTPKKKTSKPKVKTKKMKSKDKAE